MPQFSKLTKSLAFITSALAISLSLAYLVLAWTEPGSAPPAGNVPAPINVGDSAQIKSGPLQVNGFRNTGNTILDGNVGIGTAIPGAKLDVAGPLKLLPMAQPFASALQKRELYTLTAGQVST